MENRWLYFNNEADDDSVGVSTNVMFPAKNLISMEPNGDTALNIIFKSVREKTSASGDIVVLNVGTNKHKEVISAIAQKINSTRPNFNGFINVADDLTTIVGGSATLTPITLDDNITSCNAITLAAGDDATNGAIVATADGTGTGTIPGGGFYTVTSTNNDHIVTLPAAVPGTIVYLNSKAEASEAYELRTPTPGSIAINGGSGSNAESAIAASDALVIAYCLATNNWVANTIANDGTIDKVEAAA